MAGAVEPSPGAPTGTADEAEQIRLLTRLCEADDHAFIQHWLDPQTQAALSRRLEQPEAHLAAAQQGDAREQLLSAWRRGELPPGAVAGARKFVAQWRGITAVDDGVNGWRPRGAYEDAAAARLLLWTKAALASGAHWPDRAHHARVSTLAVQLLAQVHRTGPQTVRLRLDPPPGGTDPSPMPGRLPAEVLRPLTRVHLRLATGTAELLPDSGLPPWQVRELRIDHADTLRALPADLCPWIQRLYVEAPADRAGLDAVPRLAVERLPNLTQVIFEDARSGRAGAKAVPGREDILALLDHAQAAWAPTDDGSAWRWPLLELSDLSAAAGRWSNPACVSLLQWAAGMAQLRGGDRAQRQAGVAEVLRAGLTSPATAAYLAGLRGQVTWRSSYDERSAGTSGAQARPDVNPQVLQDMLQMVRALSKAPPTLPSPERADGLGPDVPSWLRKLDQVREQLQAHDPARSTRPIAPTGMGAAQAPSPLPLPLRNALIAALEQPVLRQACTARLESLLNSALRILKDPPRTADAWCLSEAEHGCIRDAVAGALTLLSHVELITSTALPGAGSFRLRVGKPPEDLNLLKQLNAWAREAPWPARLARERWVEFLLVLQQRPQVLPPLAGVLRGTAGQTDLDPPPAELVRGGAGLPPARTLLYLGESVVDRQALSGDLGRLGFHVLRLTHLEASGIPAPMRLPCFVAVQIDAPAGVTDFEALPLERLERQMPRLGLVHWRHEPLPAAPPPLHDHWCWLEEPDGQARVCYRPRLALGELLKALPQNAATVNRLQEQLQAWMKRHGRLMQFAYDMSDLVSETGNPSLTRDAEAALYPVLLEGLMDERYAAACVELIEDARPGCLDAHTLLLSDLSGLRLLSIPTDLDRLADAAFVLACQTRAAQQEAQRAGDRHESLEDALLFRREMELQLVDHLPQLGLRAGPTPIFRGESQYGERWPEARLEAVDRAVDTLRAEWQDNFPVTRTMLDRPGPFSAAFERTLQALPVYAAAARDIQARRDRALAVSNESDGDDQAQALAALERVHHETEAELRALRASLFDGALERLAERLREAEEGRQTPPNLLAMRPEDFDVPDAPGREAA